MFGNYFKVAIRNIMNNKLYSLLNIIGLAIGLVGAILILLYCYNELTYDSYHKNSERIMRIASHYNFSGREDRYSASSLIIGPLFKDEYPEVEDYARFSNLGRILLKNGNISVYVNNCWAGNQGILNVFTHEFLYGSPNNALTGSNKVILSESFAKKLFRDVNPLEKTVKSGNGDVYKVTGVFKDFPDNTHLKYEAILSEQNYFNSLVAIAGPTYVSPQNHLLLWQVNQLNYVLLKENTNKEAFVQKTKGFFNKYMAASGKTFNSTFAPIMQPLKETHFTNYIWDEPQGKKEDIYIFLIVGLFLLSIACINYMNLSTARSAGRAKEVGLRKVVGAQKSQLVKQFLLESVVVTFIAMFFALILTELLLPTFNQLADKKIEIGLNTPWWMYIGIIMITTIVGIISGSYPAFYLSSIQPAAVIKGTITKGIKGRLIRQILVVCQFSLSIIMIIGTLIVTKQLNYLKSYEVGYNKDNVVIINGVPDSLYAQEYTAFRNEASRQTGVLDIASANSKPAGQQGKLSFSYMSKGKENNLICNLMRVDAHFLDFLGLKFIEGKNFATRDNIHSIGSDTLATNTFPKDFVVNRTLAATMGHLGKAQGQPFYPTGSTDKVNSVIVGVVDDFVYTSLHSNIEPVVFVTTRNPGNQIYIRINAENQKAILTDLERIWRKHFAIDPFEYTFLTNDVQNEYKSEDKLARVFTYFSFMCIFIACLGLLGLASYAAQQRTKEIGIRKVLGGSVCSIIILLTRDFSKLVLISNLIAWPVSYIIMEMWLKRFPYHIEVPILSFVWSALAAFVIAWITVGIIAFKTASSDPVEALRCE